MESVHPQHRSEVARLREQIAREHEAASWAVKGLAEGTAQHWFITRRMERLADHQTRLAALIGEQASMDIMVEVWKGSPAQHPQEQKEGVQHVD